MMLGWLGKKANFLFSIWTPLEVSCIVNSKGSYINLVKISIGIDGLFSLLHLWFLQLWDSLGRLQNGAIEEQQISVWSAICIGTARKLMGFLSLAGIYFSSALKTGGLRNSSWAVKTWRLICKCIFTRKKHFTMCLTFPWRKSKQIFLVSPQTP